MKKRDNRDMKASERGDDIISVECSKQRINGFNKLFSKRAVSFVLAVMLLLSVFSLAAVSVPVSVNENEIALPNDNETSKVAGETVNPKISSYLQYTLKHGQMKIEEEIKDEEMVVKSVTHKPLGEKIEGFILTYEPLTDEQVQQLEALGVNIVARMGTVTTAYLPVDAIDEIAELEFVEGIEGSQPVFLALDAAIPEAGVDQAWARDCTGEDVIVGIVDSGIDWTHGDFWFDAAKTNSKILYLWDQTDAVGPAPAPPYGYGTEWTKADIEAGICREVDTVGHGTHVAGIATSTGLETGRYRGVAPDANIIFVKRRGESVNAVNGMKYIVEKAKSLGKPAVISLSIYTQFGPRDGTQPWERAIDWCTAQGVPVAVAAGNEAQFKIHARTPGPDPYGGTYDTGDFYILDARQHPANRPLFVDMYYDLDDNVSIRVIAPSGNNLLVAETSATTGPQPWGSIDVYYSTTTLAKGYLIVTSDISGAGDDFDIEITVTNKRDVAPLNLNRWDAWTWSRETFGIFTDPTEYTVYGTCYPPANAHTAITVGGYSTKDCWLSKDGNVYCRPDATLNDIAPFSSYGPTRDGRMKPEITASGCVVMSALSKDTAPFPPDVIIDPGDKHRIMSGTSMSTPFVAGAVALYLDKDPTATPAEIRNYYMSTAREDAFTGTTWPTVENQVWGAGKIDVSGLCLPALVPTLTPIGIIALVSLLSIVAAISIRTSIRKKRR